MKALRSGGLLLLLGVLATAGCGTHPFAVQAIPTVPDSTRWVSSPGTPFAICTVWRHGAVNVSLEVHILVESRNPAAYCAARQVAVYRGQREGATIHGTLVTVSDPSLPTSGTMHLWFDERGEVLSGLVVTTVSTPCGNGTIETPLQMQPEASSPEVPNP